MSKRTIDNRACRDSTSVARKRQAKTGVGQYGFDPVEVKNPAGALILFVGSVLVFAFFNVLFQGLDELSEADKDDNRNESR